MKLILFSFFTAFFIVGVFASEVVMKHMPEGNKCITCHRPETPHQLLLRDGKRIKIDHVDLLCGQCHGIKHRKWLIGMHGKVVDSWKTAERKRLSCIVCHDPHTPKFPKLEAKAPPRLRKH